MSTCAICARPADAHICHDCANETRAALGRIRTLWPELDPVICRQTSYGPKLRARAAERPLPVNLTAADTGREIRNTLTTWARHISDHTGDTLPDDRIEGICEWMRTRIDRMRTTPEISELMTDMIEAADKLRRAVDLPPEQRYAGPCEERTDDGICPGELWIHPGDSRAMCPECGADHDIRRRFTELLDRCRDMLMTAGEIARFATDSGEFVGAHAIRKWADRGRLTARCRARNGKPLYRVQDVLDLLAGLAGKRAS